MPDQNYNTGNGLTHVGPDAPAGKRGRKPTPEEAEAILLLVRSGWLTIKLDLSED